jgi:hypothetical protein
MFSHHFHDGNEHARKVEDGEAHGSGSEDRANERDLAVDPRLSELIDFGAPI